MHDSMRGVCVAAPLQDVWPHLLLQLLQQLGDDAAQQVSPPRVPSLSQPARGRICGKTLPLFCLEELVSGSILNNPCFEGFFFF